MKVILSPFLLKRLNRLVFELLMKPGKKGFERKMLGVFSILLQRLLDGFQWLRMRSKLNRLAFETKKNNIKIFGIKVWYGEAFYWSKYLTSRLKKINPGYIHLLRKSPG